MATVVPALLGADPLRLADAVRAVERAGAPMLHLDMMDGRFVDDVSFGLRTIRSVAASTQLPLDVHLQVAEPDRYLRALIDMPVRMVTVHVEAMRDPARVLRTLAAAGVGGALALNPGTPLAAACELFDEIEQVTIMTSSPGTSEFLGYTVSKVRRLRRLLDSEGKADLSIAADGGVTPARTAELIAAGVDRLIAASAIFGHPDGVAAGIAAFGAAGDEAPADLATEGAQEGRGRR